MMIRRVLISVYDKRGLETLLEELRRLGVKIVASSGTARRIRELSYDAVMEVSEYTGHPESPGGLLKTLHPKIHGGILLDPENPEQGAYMERQGIEPFNLVIINLYPFEEAAQQGSNPREAARFIDIGGPAMIRAAAKASMLRDDIAVVVDPSQYQEVVEALRREGRISEALKRRLTLEAFKRTAEYDEAITRYLEGLGWDR
jgi:phosphoribosylaminoimidazolecarboxamide formyltransferase/IMP cyclohydrolase